MAQPQAVRIICIECNGWYATERELWNHMYAVHRRFVSEQSTLQHRGTKTDSCEDQLGVSRERWAKLSVQWRNRVQSHFNPEELDVIDRFILIASQGPLSLDARR